MLRGGFFPGAIAMRHTANNRILKQLKTTMFSVNDLQPRSHRKGLVFLKKNGYEINSIVVEIVSASSNTSVRLILDKYLS